MDRETLMDDLDLILERSRGDELPGEWDWSPPSGRARSRSRPGSRGMARSTGQTMRRRTTPTTKKKKKKKKTNRGSPRR